MRFRPSTVIVAFIALLTLGRMTPLRKAELVATKYTTTNSRNNPRKMRNKMRGQRRGFAVVRGTVALAIKHALTWSFEGKLTGFRRGFRRDLEADKGATQKLALKSVSCGDGLFDPGVGRRFGFRINELMGLFVERLARLRFE